MTSNDETVMDRRCVELRFLAGWAERTLSDAVGHSVTRGIIEEDAVWLSDRGLVITELLAGVLLVRLTPRGEVVPKGARRRRRLGQNAGPVNGCSSVKRGFSFLVTSPESLANATRG
jgi:hypothetical protein